MIRRQTAVGAGGALAVLGAFAVLFHPTAVLGALALADPTTLAVGAVSALVALACWSEALFVLLRGADAPIGRSQSFAAYNAGLLARRVLPLGNAAGTALLAYAVSRGGGLRYDRTLGVATVADLCNHATTVTLAALAVVAMLALGDGGPVVRAVGAAVLVGAFALTALVALLFYRRDLVERGVVGTAERLAGRLGRRLPRAARALDPERVRASLGECYDAVDAVGRDRRVLARTFALSFTARVCYALPFYVALRALGAHVPLAVALFVVVAGSAAALVPLPGGVGSVEFALAGLLLAFTGLDASVAVAAVVCYRACTYWLLLLVDGLVVLLAGADVRFGVADDEVSAGTPETD